MGARKDYVINVALRGDDSGIQPLEKGLKDIETRAEGLATHRGIKINANIGGNAIETLREIQSGLNSLDNHTIKVDLGGNFDSNFKNIESHLSKIASNTETKITVSGNAKQEIRSISDLIANIDRNNKIKFDVDLRAIEQVVDIIAATSTETAAISGTLSGAMEGIAHDMATAFQGVTSEIGKISRELSTLGNSQNTGIGNKLANEFEGASFQVGKIQSELNNLKAPTIQPKVEMPDMNQYYGSYDQLGHLNMGAIGGSSILSMIGVGAFKNVTYANASKEQTNAVLLSRMDEGATTKIGATTYEGGTDTITHAVSQRRTVRNPDLISQLYAFQMATGATNEELVGNVFGGPNDTEWGSGSAVDVLAAFGESVALQTGSEQLGTSAMFDLAKAFGGQYASVDQYGISEETLKVHGYDPKSENVTEFMRAVGEIIHADAPNELMDTTEGGLTTLRKRFHRAGRQIGQIMMGPIDFLSSQLLKIDKQDFNFAGITIPAGTFSTVIIGITGLVSAIGPLQQTLKAVKDTFNKVTGAIKTASDGIIGLAEKIANLGNLDKLQRFNDFGAYNILSQDTYGKVHEKEILEANIERITGVNGIHDFTDSQIDDSSMTWDQKRRTKNSKAVDEKLFNLEPNLSDEQLKIFDKLKREKQSEWIQEAREKGLEGTDIRDYVNSKYKTGRMNEISELSNWGKLKYGAKLSFNPQTSAFGDAFKKEKDKYKDGGFLDQIKSKTVGNLRGISKGLSALKETGGLTNSLKSLGGVFGALVGAINPVTVIVGALSAGLAALGAVFAIAWANSEDFQKKVGELGQKLHDLFDTIVTVMGNFLQDMGVTEHGGAQGIVDLATAIVDNLEVIVDVLQNIFGVMNGRQLKQSKKMDQVEPDFKKVLDQIKDQETEKGIGHADKELYESAMNMANQLKSMDPTYFTEDKIQELGLDKPEYVDSNGLTWAEALSRDLDDETGYSYYRDDVIPELKTEGIDVDYDTLKSSLKNEDGTWNKDAVNELNKSISEYKLWLNSDGTMGQDWNDTAFVKSHSALRDDDISEEDQKKREEKQNTPASKMIGFLKTVVDVLGIIEKLAMGIFVLLAADKVLGGISRLLSAKDAAGSWGGAAWNVFKDKFPELGTMLENLRNNGWGGIWDTINQGVHDVETIGRDNVLNAEKVRDVFTRTRTTVEGMFPNIYEWVQRINALLNEDIGTSYDTGGDDYYELPEGDKTPELPEGDKTDTDSSKTKNKNKNKNKKKPTELPEPESTDKNKNKKTKTKTKTKNKSSKINTKPSKGPKNSFFGNTGNRGIKSITKSGTKSVLSNVGNVLSNVGNHIGGPTKNTKQLPSPNKNTKKLPEGPSKNTKKLQGTKNGKVIDVEIVNEPKWGETAKTTTKTGTGTKSGIGSKIKGFFTDIGSRITPSSSGKVIEVVDGKAKTGILQTIKTGAKEIGGKISGKIGGKIGMEALGKVGARVGTHLAGYEIPGLGEALMAWDISELANWGLDQVDPEGQIFRPGLLGIQKYGSEMFGEATSALESLPEDAGFMDKVNTIGDTLMNSDSLYNFGKAATGPLGLMVDMMDKAVNTGTNGETKDLKEWWMNTFSDLWGSSSSQPDETNTNNDNITDSTSAFSEATGSNPLSNLFGITPTMNGTVTNNNPLQINPNNMSLTPQSLTNNNNQPSNITNTINIEGVTDGEDLAERVMNVINSRLLWDAQKAGRTVDKSTNLTF